MKRARTPSVSVSFPITATTPESKSTPTPPTPTTTLNSSSRPTSVLPKLVSFLYPIHVPQVRDQELCDPTKPVYYENGNAYQSVDENGKKVFCNETIERAHPKAWTVDAVSYLCGEGATVLSWFDERIGCGSFNCAWGPKPSMLDKIYSRFGTTDCVLRFAHIDDSYHGPFNPNVNYDRQQQASTLGYGPRVLSPLYDCETNLIGQGLRINETRSKSFFVLQNSGDSLKNWLQKTNATRQERYQVFLAIIDKIKIMHLNQVTHNDLHTGNVLVKTDQNHKLVYVCFIDFDRLLQENSVSRMANDYIVWMNSILNRTIDPDLQTLAIQYMKSIEEYDFNHSTGPSTNKNVEELFDLAKSTIEDWFHGRL